MLLSGYTRKVHRPECNPKFESLHCIAHLNEDVSCALPYLNAVLGGSQYLENPPEVMFHHHGKIIKVSAREIAVNALKDEREADAILDWLKNEINGAWEHRREIKPSCKGRRRPQLIRILKLLPQTNCRKCGLSTCMVFAAQAMEGGRDASQCPEMSVENRGKLESYLAAFAFE